MSSDFSESSRCAPISITQQQKNYGVVQEAISSLWQVVNGLSTIQPPKQERYRVTIFGSARITKDSSIYEDVKRLASELTYLGCDIITGGGSGLMEAANEGSVVADPSGKTKSIGIYIDLEFEQAINPFVEEVFQHQTFFSRLQQFAMMSDAFVVVPGGIGTTLEALMIWQLLQVHALPPVPFIMLGEMWEGLVQWADQTMVPDMVDTADLKIPVCVRTVDEAIAILKTAQEQWQGAC